MFKQYCFLLKASYISDSDVLCPKHSQPLLLFCDEPKCQKLICVKCVPRDHAKHHVKDTEDKVKEEKEKLNKMLEVIGAVKVMISNELNLVSVQTLAILNRCGQACQHRASAQRDT